MTGITDQYALTSVNLGALSSLPDNGQLYNKYFFVWEKNQMKKSKRHFLPPLLQYTPCLVLLSAHPVELITMNNSKYK